MKEANVFKKRCDKKREFMIVKLDEKRTEFLPPRSSRSHSNGNIITFCCCFDRHTFTAPCDELKREHRRPRVVLIQFPSLSYHSKSLDSTPSVSQLSIRNLTGVSPLFATLAARIYNRELRLVETNTGNRSRIYYVCSFLYFLYVHLAR